MKTLTEQEEIRIYELIESFHYDELSVEDRHFIDQTIGVEEYRSLRHTFQLAISAPTHIQPLVSKQKKSTGGLFAVKIPLYQAAAAIVLLIVGFSLFRKEKVIIQQDKVVVVDTLYLEKPTQLLAADTSERNDALQRKNAAKQTPAIRVIEPATPNAQISRSLRDDSLLKTFMVTL